MEKHHWFEEKEERMGKSMDPRLISLLEIFQELYVRRKELFKKIFSGKHGENEFEEFLDKIREVLGRSGVVPEEIGKSRGLRRSMSIGSPRELKGRRGEPSLRMERFKVRIVDVGDVKGEGGGGKQGTETKSTGIK